MKISSISCGFLLILSLSIVIPAFAQEEKEEERKEKTKLSFRDPEDNCLDLSDWIINKNGFVPMPIIITEPALGGFGGGLAPVFIQQNKPIERDGKMYPMPPDITAGFAGYTLNDSWAAGAARVGTVKKWGLRYTVAAAYADVNMEYYFHLDKLDKDIDLEANIKAIPVFASISKQLNNPRLSVGLQYLFMHNELELKNNNNYDNPIINELNEKIGDYISDYVSGNVAKLGLKAAFDSRDNTFTPNKGIKAYATAEWSNPVVGSNSKFGQFEEAFYYYHPIRYNLITGFRFDTQQIAGNLPFYLKPFIDMRGVPTARYQGKITALAEIEERWDFTKRWSVLLFGGGGKGFDKFNEFNDAEWAWSYGTGFRYLMARKLNLRMGVDLAMGTEGFTYYLVFGSSWLRQ